MMKRAFAVAAGLVVGVSALQAQMVAPHGTYSAALPAGVTFGGMRIPGPVMTTTAPSGVRLTIGASNRFAAPTLGDDGAGTYTALAGVGSVSPLRSLWNFNFAVTGVTSPTTYTYGLFWDYDNASGTVLHNGFFFNTATDFQDSYNLGFSFIDPNPAAPNYDPNAAGEFTFFLAAFTYNPAVSVPVGIPDYNVSTPILGQGPYVSIRVNVVPEPSTYALMALGLGAVAMAARRRRGAVKST